MQGVMRRKKRTWCYFGITIIFTFLGYYKCQSNMRSDETQSPWSRTPVTKSVIHHSTDGLAHTQRTVATTIDPTTNLIKDTMIYGRTDKENSSTSLLQYISNVSPFEMAVLTSTLQNLTSINFSDLLKLAKLNI